MWDVAKGAVKGDGIEGTVLQAVTLDSVGGGQGEGH